MSNPKRVLFEHFAAVARALGSGHRLEILELVAQGARCVEDLAQRTGITVANASQHLQHLRRAGLVAAQREGKRIYYELSDEAVVELLGSLRRIAERNVAEVERVIKNYFHELDSLEPVSRAELARKMKSGAVTIIDVRPPEEFASGHIAGAVNIPLKELASKLRSLPKSREIVAYCRGPFCVLSYEAVQMMRGRGLRARRLEDGYPEWKIAGLPVESGTIC